MHGVSKPNLHVTFYGNVQVCTVFQALEIHVGCHGPREMYRCARCFQALEIQPTCHVLWSTGNVQVCTCTGVHGVSKLWNYMSRFMVRGKCTGVHGVSKLWKSNLHVTFYSPREMCRFMWCVQIQLKCHISGATGLIMETSHFQYTNFQYTICFLEIYSLY